MILELQLRYISSNYLKTDVFIPASVLLLSFHTLAQLFNKAVTIITFLYINNMPTIFSFAS